MLIYVCVHVRKFVSILSTHKKDNTTLANKKTNSRNHLQLKRENEPVPKSVGTPAAISLFPFPSPRPREGVGLLETKTNCFRSSTK